ncbi:hypothetical protein OH492_02340 [Vibrio chagasii]|nr:hypothetical protein [Vibrio chagasii]
MAVFLTVTLIRTTWHPDAEMGDELPAEKVSRCNLVSVPILVLVVDWVLWSLINRVQLADGLYSIQALSGGVSSVCFL